MINMTLQSRIQKGLRVLAQSWYVALAGSVFLLQNPMAAAQDADTETGIEDDLTVQGKQGTKTDPDLEVNGYAAFGTNFAGAAVATAGVGNVYIQNNLEVGSNFCIGSVYQVDSLGRVILGTWNATAVAIAAGGTGQTTANGAFNALAPSQAGNAGKFLATDASTTSWADPIPNAVNMIILTEEFCSGLNTAGNIGNLGWQINSIGAAPTISSQAAEVNHWGILRLQTPATLNQGGTIALSGNTATTLSARPQPGTTIRFALKINSASLVQTTIRIGIATSPTLAQPTDGIYLEYVSGAGAGNWVGVCRAGGVQTATGNLLAGDLNTWHRFQIRYNAASSVYFSVDGGGESQVANNIPANTVGVQPSIRVVTTEAVAKNIDLDYYQIVLTGITR